jgi:hypothetical protein
VTYTYPDPAHFVSGFQDVDQKMSFFCLLPFEGTLYQSSRTQRSNKTVEIKVLLNFFA